MIFATCYLSCIHMISYCDNKDNIVCRPGVITWRSKLGHILGQCWKLWTDVCVSPGTKDVRAWLWICSTWSWSHHTLTYVIVCPVNRSKHSCFWLSKFTTWESLLISFPGETYMIESYWNELEPLWLQLLKTTTYHLPPIYGNCSISPTWWLALLPGLAGLPPHSVNYIPEWPEISVILPFLSIHHQNLAGSCEIFLSIAWVWYDLLVYNSTISALVLLMIPSQFFLP